MNRLTSTASPVQALRDSHYNATVTEFRLVHSDLAIIRVRHDDGPIHFVAGQYTTLGLGYWEPRLPGVQAERVDEHDRERVIRRAYSISSPILDAHGRVVSVHESDEVEFYVALVRNSEDRVPALTPRLFELTVGDRVFMSAKCHGHYTLQTVQPTDAVVFMATGTGEAPHNAMLSELLSRPHHGPIVSVVCTRFRRDLGYLETHRLLERTHTNYSYWPLTTREPENTDPNHASFVGKQYIQEYFASGQLEHDCGFTMNPQCTKVFLCGNPAMIGAPHPAPPHAFPEPIGLVELLVRRGFRIDEARKPGNVHFEKFWS